MDFLQWQGWICLAWLLRSEGGFTGGAVTRLASVGLLAGAPAACSSVTFFLADIPKVEFARGVKGLQS